MSNDLYRSLYDASNEYDRPGLYAFSFGGTSSHVSHYHFAYAKTSYGGGRSVVHYFDSYFLLRFVRGDSYLFLSRLSSIPSGLFVLEARGVRFVGRPNDIRFRVVVLYQVGSDFSTFFFRRRLPIGGRVRGVFLRVKFVRSRGSNASYGWLFPQGVDVSFSQDLRGDVRRSTTSSMV